MDSGERPLARARLIATLNYVAPLVAFPLIGRSPHLAVVGVKALAVLGPMLLVIGISDYVASLFIERTLLRRAKGWQGRAQHPVVTAAVVVSAFGAALAVYGLVLTLLGAPAWGATLYVLCAVHGLHLMIRWPDYQSASEEVSEPE